MVNKKGDIAMPTEESKLKRLRLRIETCLKTSRSVIIQHEDAEYLLRLLTTVDSKKFIKEPAEPKVKREAYQVLEARDLRIKLFDSPGTPKEKIQQVLNDTHLSLFEFARLMKVSHPYLRDMLDNILLPKHQADIIRWKLGFSHGDMKPYIKLGKTNETLLR